MLNKKQIAIIKKDLYNITANKRMFSVMLIVPIVLTVFVPSIFILTVQFAPENEVYEIARLFENISGDAVSSSLEELRDTANFMLINYILPLFFLLVPIMASSVMAASAFIGEKEKNTLETLLYCPLPLKDIFKAKILASFAMGMAVSIFSFLIMFLVIELELFLITGVIVMPGINWLIIMLLVSPSVSLLAVNLIVRGSAKAQSTEESQQRSVFLVLPVILLMVGQFTGIMMLSTWLLLSIGAVLAAGALFMLNGISGKFQYETLLN